MCCPIWVKSGTRDLYVMLLRICDFVKIGAVKSILYCVAQMKSHIRLYRETD